MLTAGRRIFRKFAVVMGETFESAAMDWMVAPDDEHPIP